MVKTRADFQPDITPMEETLEQVKATLRQHFEIKDWQGVDIILATAVAHYIPGEMLWLRFIGPSRSGRTELLRAVAGHADCAEMEVLTPAAFSRQSPSLPGSLLSPTGPIAFVRGPVPLAGALQALIGICHLVSELLSNMPRFAIWLSSEEPGSIDYFWVYAQQTRMNPEDNQLIAVGWQLAEKVDSDRITTVNINLKTAVLKLLSGLVNKILVRIKDVELINYGRLELFRMTRTARVVKVASPESDDGTGNPQCDS